MLAKVRSCALIGLDGNIVEVEVDIYPGLPAFNIVGLPDAAVQESKERVRSAIRDSGYTFPIKRIVVNLAPADVKKAGPVYDLPITLAILLSSEQVTADTSNAVLLGELSLDGSLRHTNGILPMVALARQQGLAKAIIPLCDAEEASLVDGIDIIPVESLSQLISYLSGEIELPGFKSLRQSGEGGNIKYDTDMADIKGQEHVKRALEIAAAGGHNIIMCGPPRQRQDYAGSFSGFHPAAYEQRGSS